MKKNTVRIKKSGAKVKKIRAGAKKPKGANAGIKRNKLKPLYSFKLSRLDDTQSRRIFDKKPSDFTDEEIKRLVKGVNDRLYLLEKAGLTLESRTYQNIMHYAEGGDKMYNINDEKMTVRVTGDLNRFKTPQEKYDYIRRLQQIMSNQTSTAGGTMKQLQRAYESFMQNPMLFTNAPNGEKMPVKLSFNDYREIWKSYKANVEPDQKGKWESDDVIDFIHAVSARGYEDIPPESLDRAFRYWQENKKDYEDMYAFMIDNPDVFSTI